MLRCLLFKKGSSDDQRFVVEDFETEDRYSFPLWWRWQQRLQDHERRIHQKISSRKCFESLPTRFMHQNSMFSFGVWCENRAMTYIQTTDEKPGCNRYKGAGYCQILQSEGLRIGSLFRWRVNAGRTIWFRHSTPIDKQKRQNMSYQIQMHW